MTTLRTDELTSESEIKAKEAETLPAFAGLSLTRIKRSLAIVLDQIGKNGMFSQFTRHDITHINKCLAMLDWLVPAGTKAAMSSSDWLLVVLSVYFHDLGMLISVPEFSRRHGSGFVSFREELMKTPAEWKPSDMSTDECERFLYQEFVRKHHAARIKQWIAGPVSVEFGVSSEIVAELNDILATLNPIFRRDLGLICESHHLDDLGDFKKYKLSQPYGDSPSETANVQYAASILRTVDLLHVTSERTPSVEFRMISPSNPISQEEWAKQQAVRSVRAKEPALREDGSESRYESDTVEVHAYFTKIDGFFALTEYLKYAERQLNQTYVWNQSAQKQNTSSQRYSFPWRHIDDSNIEAQGFLTQSFEFTIDRTRVLDLLTGHTLYNNVNVVIRELVQNALDAVRVQQLDESNDMPPEVAVSWDPSSRMLTVKDNGTGMTQEIIENHLLRVGSSRYQDGAFKKKYPGFSPISRFGIGLLSCFMISDEVEIVTVSSSETSARQLSLRSVHGKYLVRLIDKGDPSVRDIGPHGTSITVRVRRGALVDSVIATMRYWVVVPRCRVTARVVGQAVETIGYANLSEALSAVLMEKMGIDVSKRKNIRVVELSDEGNAMAVALQWSNRFREWSFVSTGFRDNDVLGTCVEGIRVENGTPGFVGSPFLAMGNACGVGAPRTNVARSQLEPTAERDAALSAFYGMYCRHISAEVEELWRNRGFSSTWAVTEARWLSALLLNGPGRPVQSALLDEKLRQIPALLIEEEGKRSLVSAAQSVKNDAVWTVDCAFFRSAELMLREVKGSGSLAALLAATAPGNYSLPSGAMLCNFGDLSFSGRAELFFPRREVDIVNVSVAERRVDLRWVSSNGPARWWAFPESIPRDLVSKWKQRAGRRSVALSLKVARTALDVRGVTKEMGVAAFGITFLFSDSPFAKYFMRLVESAEKSGADSPFNAIIGVVQLASQTFGRSTRALTIDNIRRQLDEDARPGDELDLEELFEAIRESSWDLFSPDAWRRSRNSGGPESWDWGDAV